MIHFFTVHVVNIRHILPDFSRKKRGEENEFSLIQSSLIPRPNWLLISVSLSIKGKPCMPKLVTTVTAAHISVLIDSVQAVAGRAKPRLMGEGMRLMGEGMRMIVCGYCQPGSQCTWSVERESTQTNPFASFPWPSVPHTLCVSAISLKGNGYREESYSIHSFGGTWCNQ